MGNLAHRALADWDCLGAPPDELRAKLATWARRAGITTPDALEHAVGQVLGALHSLRRTAFFHEIATAPERHAEIPFSLETPVGTLHGVIDLLFRDSSGEWRLVDWKTEPVGRGQTLAEAAQPYLLQMAVYALAAERILGIQPTVEICFLSSRADVYRCTAAELEMAWRSVTTDAGSLATD